MNANGAIAWNKDIGSDGDDNLRSIKEIERDKYLIGGFSWGGAYGNKKDVSRGSSDFWVVTLNYLGCNATVTNTPLNATAQVQAKAPSFRAFPNPVKDVLNVRISGKAVVTLTDLLGKVVTAKNIEGDGKIDVSTMPAGLYFLKNSINGITQKIIVAK